MPQTNFQEPTPLPGLLQQPSIPTQPAQPLLYVPGAYDQSSSDVLKRGLTADEYNTYIQQAIALRDNPANLGDLGNRLFQSKMQEAEQIATGRLSTLRQSQENQTLMGQQRQSQLAQLTALQASLMGKLPGIEDQMNQNLVGQEKFAQSQMNPLIEQRLNALGLLQSGALPQAQAYYQSQLDQARQARMQDFDTQQQQALQIQMPQDITGFDINAQQSAMQNQMGLSQAMLQRQFGLQDVGNQQQLQMQLSAQALADARRQQNLQNNYALGGSALGALGQVAGGYLSGMYAKPPAGQVAAPNPSGGWQPSQSNFLYA